MQFSANRSISSAAGSSFRQQPSTKAWRSSGFFGNLFGSSDFGDSQSDAENIGKLKRSRSYDYSGDVGRNDPDFFRFKISRKRSPFSARLTNDRYNRAPIAISILNKQGQVVKTDNQYLFKNIEVGETAVLSTQRLRKGTYFFRILSATGSSEDYKVNFSLSASSAPSPNNVLNLGRLTPGRSYRYTGYVGRSDVDFYRFSVETSSRLSASLFNNTYRGTFSTDSIAISILDDRQQTVRTSSGRYLFANVEPYTEETLFDPTLPAGEYYIRIQSAEGKDLNYQLDLRRSFLFAV
jgi:hypothetical protein